MLRRVGALHLFASLFAAFLTATSASADLPDILSGPKNVVPECATPGRLMAYLKSRNPQLDPRYDSIAAEYMRQGEMLGVRWDFAFYQMVVETGALTYWRGHRAGDVKPVQNNFAGLGASGRGEHGETFPDIATGVRAHLEHLLLYAGKSVDNPVAQRTRNVRDWGVLTAWQKTFTRPITYTDMSARWAQSKTYASMLKLVADRFDAEVCGQPDPRPWLVQEARQQSGKAPPAQAAITAPATPPSTPIVADAEPKRPSGEELAQQAIEQGKAEGSVKRFALGALTPPAAAPSTAPFKVLNPPASEPPAQAAEPPPAKLSTGSVTPTTPDVTKAAIAPANSAPPAAKLPSATKLPPAATLPPAAKAKAAPAESTKTALAAPAAKAKMAPETAVPPAANQRCRVWTASYGGQRAMLIRSVVDQVVNFTVLDVNEGSETREAEAFISAYAKNGKIAGVYGNQALALDKAFELCPEG